jgi:RNA polymerase sigma-70 factor (ECF subfamily)
MSVVNDGFIKVFKNIDKFQFKGSFEGWIRKIVYNSIRDYYRKASNKHLFIELDEKTKLSETYNNLGYEEIINLVDTLPETSKNIFIMHAIEGYNHREIAEIKKMSISTSKWHLSKAKEQLKKLLAKKDILYLNV